MTAVGRTAPDGHYPALDGLRGIAILGVLALHYLVRAPVLPTRIGWWLHELSANGEYGVDLFFVLSGFLITRILLSTRGSPSYFVSFYARRALRIFPLYYLALGVLTLLLPAVQPSIFGQWPDPPASVGWFWSYLANWPMAINGWRASPPQLMHFWSLAVEEQFYVVWPAIVLLIGPARLPAFGGLLIAGSSVVSFALLHTWPPPSVVPVATLTRLDGLVLGALVAVWWTSSRPVLIGRRLVWPLFWLTLTAVVVIRTWRGSLDTADHVVMLVGLPLISACLAALLAGTLLSRESDPLIRVLTAKPLRTIGRYSYAMYVVHYPVLLALTHAGFTVPGLRSFTGSTTLAELGFVAVNGLLTVGGALLSWHLLEKWFLRLKDRFPYAASQVEVH